MDSRAFNAPIKIVFPEIFRTNMNIIEDIIYSIYTHKLLGKWWCLLFFPSVLFSQFHVVEGTKVTINSDVIVSEVVSSTDHIAIDKEKKAKIYVTEETTVYGLGQNVSISYIKSEPEPKAKRKNRPMLVKKEKPAKNSSQEPKVINKKPDSFKIIPVSIPSGSFSSVVKMQNAVLPFVKRSKTSMEGELLFYETYKIVFPDDSCISGYFPHTVFCNLRYCGKKWTSRPPPFSV